MIDDYEIRITHEYFQAHLNFIKVELTTKNEVKISELDNAEPMRLLREENKESH